MTRAFQNRDTAEPVAWLAGASKTYGDVVALDHVDLEIRRGEVLALLGPNGAGKTTTVNLLLGLARPSAGDVRLFGCPPHDTAARRRVGAMLQISGAPQTLTVREHVQLVSSYYPDPLPLAETLALAGLEGLERRPFGKLSGGQKQRVFFALAVCGNPDLLFLDEPTVGLDVEARRGLWQCIRQLVSGGRTVLLTTHYLQEAEELASRVVVLGRGRVVAAGTPEEVKALTHGRRIRCRTRLAAAELVTWPDVDRVERHGDVTELLARRAEPVVLELLQRDRQLSDLEIKSAGLEEALIALTEDNEPEEIAA